MTGNLELFDATLVLGGEVVLRRGKRAFELDIQVPASTRTINMVTLNDGKQENGNRRLQKAGMKKHSSKKRARPN